RSRLKYPCPAIPLSRQGGQRRDRAAICQSRWTRLPPRPMFSKPRADLPIVDVPDAKPPVVACPGLWLWAYRCKAHSSFRCEVVIDNFPRHHAAQCLRADQKAEKPFERIRQISQLT